MPPKRPKRPPPFFFSVRVVVVTVVPGCLGVLDCFGALDDCDESLNLSISRSMLFRNPENGSLYFLVVFVVVMVIDLKTRI